jgi:cell division protein FtsL
MSIIIPIIAILSLFIVLPGIVFSFLYKVQKDKTDIKKLELEVEKQKNQLRLLEEENKRYDRIIKEEHEA